MSWQASASIHSFRSCIRTIRHASGSRSTAPFTAPISFRRSSAFSSRTARPDGCTAEVTAAWTRTVAPSIFAGVLLDITDQKRVEEQLRIAQSAGEIGTFEHIDGFATASVSPQFCRLLGLQPANNLPVRTINGVVHRADPPLIDATTTVANGRSGVEFRIVRPDTREERWLMRRGEYISDATMGGTRFSGVIYDITTSKRTEERLRELNDTLELRVREQVLEREGIGGCHRIFSASPTDRAGG